MTEREPIEPDFQTAIVRLLEGLPSRPPGSLRLYRIEATAPRAALADWIVQGLAASGATEAAGRWYSSSPLALGFYARDSWPWEPALRFIDVDRDVAELHRVGATRERVAGRSPREFSADHETEYFLPRALADARLDGGLVSAAIAACHVRGPR